MWLEDPRIDLQRYWDSKSLAQVWICSKEKIMQCWNPKFKKIKVWKIWSDSRLKWMKCVLNLILSIGMPYYQERCNIDYLTRLKVLIDNPLEDPERKPLIANIEILKWSNLDLMDQLGSYKQGFGVLWPWPVWPICVLTVLLSVEFCRNFRIPIHPSLGDIQGSFNHPVVKSFCHLSN